MMSFVLPGRSQTHSSPDSQVLRGPSGSPGVGSPGRIGYVLKVFPRVSETFVINEIRALEDAGVGLDVFSLHQPPVAVPHGILRQLRSPVRCVEAAAAPRDEEVRHAVRVLVRGLDVSPALQGQFLPRKYVRLALMLAEMVRRCGICHLHAHFASRAGHVAALAAALSGCSYSITAHAKDIYHYDVDREVLRWKLAHARFVVTVSDYNRRFLEGLLAGVPGMAEKLVRLYNGVDLTRFLPAPYPSSGRPLLLGVGRLVEKKGFALLVGACRVLRDRGYRFSAEIIGGGPEEVALREQIAAVGLCDQVRLLGVLPTEEVGRRLRDAAAVALPCLVARDGNVDALPTVLLEAMAVARPVVSTRLSGIPEIVADGQTGLLVPPGDAGAMAAALGSMLDNPGRAATMGKAGRERAERLFDLRASAARLRHLLLAPDAAGGTA